jgi:FAD:protein FMN transferase
VSVGVASFGALGTTAVVATTDDASLPAARQLLVELLDEVDAACSRFRPDSELMRAHVTRDDTAVSPLLARAVGVALDAAAATRGLVTPTLGASLRAAGYDRTYTLVRERGRWTPTIAPLADWRTVVLDRQRSTLTIPRGVELDLGATAKALAADLAAASLAQDLDVGVLVALGGDVAVAGDSPPEGWVVRVADDHAAPLDGDGPLVAVREGGLATSSTTVRRWPTDAGTAHHLLDPRTGVPAVSRWRTVSVAARSCVSANVAALAAILLDDDAPTWLGAQGVHARLVANGGAVSFVGAWPEDALAA